MKIFVNLPVKDLKKSNAFFSGLGFSFNPQFSGDHATCIPINDEAWVMLLLENYFKTFTPKNISDAHHSTEVLIAISQDSREEVDKMIEKAISHGGSEARPVQDLGFMYSRAFNDPDDHIWEVAWMDSAALNSQQT